MGIIKPSKDQDLVAGDSKMDLKSKKKASPNYNPPDQKKYKSNSHEEYSSSKKNSQKKKGKGEMSKFAYYGKGFHPNISCMKKKINVFTQIL